MPPHLYQRDVTSLWNPVPNARWAFLKRVHRAVTALCGCLRAAPSTYFLKSKRTAMLSFLVYLYLPVISHLPKYPRKRLEALAQKLAVLGEGGVEQFDVLIDMLVVRADGNRHGIAL